LTLYFGEKRERICGLNVALSSGSEKKTSLSTTPSRKRRKVHWGKAKKISQPILLENTTLFQAKSIRVAKKIQEDRKNREKGKFLFLTNLRS